MSKFSLSRSVLQESLLDGRAGYVIQPKVAFASGLIVGAEALLRFRQKDGLEIGADILIPALDAADMLHQLLPNLVPRLADDIAVMREAGLEMPIAFNTTADDLVHGRVTRVLKELMDAGRLQKGDVSVEVTESEVLQENTREELDALLALGIAVGMDDFGTGYSSIDTLSRFPFSYIKIDYGLVSRLQSDPKNIGLARSIISLGRELALETIVEGVESEWLYNIFLFTGCGQAQGNYISPPVPLEEFISLAKNGERWPSSPIGLLYNAQVNHLSYRKAILDFVYVCHNTTMTNIEECREVLTTHISHNPQRCRLGRWYYAARDRGDDYTREPAFRLLEEPHRELHATGSALIEAVVARADKAQVLQLVGDLQRYSDMVGELLGSLIERASWREQ